MRAEAWRVARLSDGTYSAYRRAADGTIHYDMEPDRPVRRRFTDHAEALSWVATLNGKPLPKRMTADEFEQATRHVAGTLVMRGALHDILVAGATWKAAATTHGVTESGILRAMRRVAERNHPG